MIVDGTSVISTARETTSLTGTESRAISSTAQNPGRAAELVLVNSVMRKKVVLARFRRLVRRKDGDSIEKTMRNQCRSLLYKNWGERAGVEPAREVIRRIYSPMLSTAQPSFQE